MKMINIGCGDTYHKDWVNIDLNSSEPDVISSDLTKGLPFKSNSIDVCYSSHVLEHLSKSEALSFLKEQKRILKPNGIIRIVVPNLEVICTNYLEFLNKLESGKIEYEFMYDYTYLELFDQATREVRGGELLKLWNSKNISNENLKFIFARHGKEVEQVMHKMSQLSYSELSFLNKILDKLNLKGLLKAVHYLKILLIEITIFLILGSKYVNSFRTGIFRNSGEIHRAMYDRFSLKRILSKCGFKDIKFCKANESKFTNFSIFQLDEIDGNIRKPDSIFVEAVKY